MDSQSPRLKKVHLCRLPLCLVRRWHDWVSLHCLMEMRQTQRGQPLWQIQRLVRQRGQQQLALLQMQLEQVQVVEKEQILVRA